MKYVFNRTYVGPNNTSFYRGSEVPAGFSEEVLERFLRDGLISSIETPHEFIAKVGRMGKKGKVEDSVESLDPDQKVRSE